MTAVWGWTFVLVKDAISHYATLPFLALRFGLALIVMVALVRRLPDRRTLKVGALIGLALTAGYLLQTVGLQYTSPGNAGLITGLFVVFTPILERLFGRPVAFRTVVAVAVALLGTALLAGGGGGVGFGDLLMVGCAMAFALHIVLLSHWAPGLAPAPLAMVQMATASVLFSFGSVTGFHVPTGSVWFAIAVTGVLASAFGFLVQTWAQAHLSASRTALVLASEPAWALIFAVLLAGQRFVPIQAAGAALVLAAIFGHELASLNLKLRDGNYQA